VSLIENNGWYAQAMNFSFPHRVRVKQRIFNLWFSDKTKKTCREIALCQCGTAANFKFQLRDYDFFDCPHCSLRFVNPRYLASDIYDNNYFHGASHGFGFTNYEEDKKASEAYLRKYLKWISSFTQIESKKFLDVGAANGYFVDLANKSNFDALGLEISSSAVDWAVKLKRPVVKGTLETLDNGIIYDVITALDVLEHVPDPLNFLKMARKKISDQGILLINVPNAGSVFSKISGKRWHAYLPPEHWMYFNKRSLRKILEMAGFEVVFFRVISKSFTFGYIYMTISNSPQIPMIIRRSLGFINNFIPLSRVKLKVYLPLFDNLTVVAKPVRGNNAQET
jgi:2-polyprenyl-3-methyl-5-hydroxy-6-metoxy-1,4-benzoquinol methylase